MSHAVIIVGNPQANSRTRKFAEKLAEKLGLTTETVELADYAQSIFDWENPKLSEVQSRIAKADLFIVATPTYKAAYTGLLKAFLDRYNAGDLAGVVTLPFMTGGSEAHSLALNTTLVPLLAELGATVVPGLYLPMSAGDGIEGLLDEWKDRNAETVRRLIAGEGER